MKSKPKIIVLDGNALVHRSFHALPATMATKSGEITNAVYGFTNFLLKAIKEFKPAYVAVAFDLAGPTFRHEQFADYKATRVKAPDELYEQLERVKDVVKALHIPIFAVKGFEADDVIGTIAKKIGDRVDTIIVTGDLDTLQLVDDSTFVYTMSHGVSDSVLYDTKAVKERFGFGPEAQVDYKALRGDPSDNIPGVKGIGEKTATELIKEFGTVEKLYKIINSKFQIPNSKLKNIKPRILELLREHEKEAFLSKDLATIRTNVPIGFKLAEARWGNFDHDQVTNLFNELEFRSLLSRVNDLPGVDKQAKADNKFSRNTKDFSYILVDDEAGFAKFFKALKQQSAFAWDTETDSLDELNANLLGMSFSWKAGEAYFVKVSSSKSQVSSGEHNLFNYNKKIVKKELHPWVKKLKPILEDAKIKKYGHNIKFDMKVLAGYGVRVAGVDFDTMIASYLLSPDGRQHNLDAVVFNELNFSKISKDDLLGTGKNKLAFAEVPADKLSLYACEDADFTGRLVKPLAKKLKEADLAELFKTMEMPLVEVLAKMETAGIAIDAKYFAKLDKKIDESLAKLQTKIWQKAGSHFNINSVQQLRQILFSKLKISVEGVAKTKTGLSTNAEVLEKLRGAHPIIELILDYRELSKLSTTYAKALPKLINPTTGRVHTSFNQTVAATGRLSSSDPNLQNIPIKTEWGRLIRRGFVAPKGKTLVSIDYSQIELRLAAHMSGDPTMIKAFKAGEDIHSATAAAINKVPLDQVTRAMRSAAKSINFGLLYGQGPRGLAINAGISYTEAKQFIAEYFKAFSHIKKYIDNALAKARRDGYVETMFGRKRYLAEINSNNVMMAKGAERVAINAPLQGTAADIIKVAMIKIDNLLDKKFAGRVVMLLQVHDELVFEVDDKLVKSVVPALKEIMESVIKLKVPLTADAKAGDNWEEMKNVA
jgi:DNA polymerase-1